MGNQFIRHLTKTYLFAKAHPDVIFCEILLLHSYFPKTLYISLFSFVVFKEKLKWWQWVGIAIGVVAVVMLSI